MTVPGSGGCPTKEQLSKRKTLKKDFLKKYEELQGKNYLTCRTMGVGINTFYKWCKEDAWFSEQVVEIAGVHFEKIELDLLRLGSGDTKGNPTALISYLNNKAHVYNGWNYNNKHDHNNYVVKHDIDVPEGISKEITYIIRLIADKEITYEFGNNLVGLLETKLKLFEPIEFHNKLMEMEKAAKEAKTLDEKDKSDV